MSTHSRIGMVLADGKVRTIYCHWDGYPRHKAPILLEHYGTAEKVAALMDLGDLSSLGASLAPPDGAEHSFEEPCPGVCLAYGRDRGERGTESQTRDSIQEAMWSAAACGGLFLYLFDVETGEWSYWLNGIVANNTMYPLSGWEADK